MVRIGRLLGGLVLASALAACDTGGGTPAPTPAPTPTPTPAPTPTPTPTPTATNTSLNNLVADASFIENGGQSTESYPPAGINVFSAAIVSFQLQYQVSTQTYTVATTGRSQTFAPSEIDPARSWPGLVFYNKAGTPVLESLSLIRPGKPSAFPTYYVGGAAWSKTLDPASATDRGSQNIASFYGFPTAMVAIPTTGTRRYAVDLITNEVTGGPIVPGQERVRRRIGEGEILIDFVARTVSMKIVRHDIADGESGDDHWVGVGTLNSNGTISGSLNCDYDCTFGGPVTPTPMIGRLFGPGAEEIGLSYAASNGTGPLGAGAVIGHQRGLFDKAITDTTQSAWQTSYFSGISSSANAGYYAPAGSLDARVGNRFSTISNRYYLGLVFNGVGRSNAFSIDTPIAAESDARYNAYGYSVAATANLPAAEHRLFILKPAAVDPAINPQYTQGGWFRRIDSLGQRSDLWFASGYPTPLSAIPASGTAHYRAIVVGQFYRFENFEPRFFYVSGTLDYTINFATRAGTGTLTLTGQGYPDGGTLNLGTFPVSSSSFGADGKFILSVSVASSPAFGAGGGQIQGQFYGPDAGELGAQTGVFGCLFCSSPPNQNRILAAMVGQRVP